MLILGRRPNESIQIGTDIEITIIDFQAGMVRLGIEAPRSTRIWRKEVWDGVVDANHKAARAARLFAEGTLEMPHLPVSVFSGLSGQVSISSSSSRLCHASSINASSRAGPSGHVFGSPGS